MMRFITALPGIVASLLLVLPVLPVGAVEPKKVEVAGSLGVQNPPTSQSEDATPTQQRIFDALAWRDSFDVVEMPMKDWAGRMSNKIGAPVVIDLRGLQDAGLDDRTPITMTIKGISNQSAIRFVLDELDLTYLIRDECVQITSLDVAELNLVTRVYPVWDLVKPVDPNVSSDFGSLIDLIETTFSPTSWVAMGGPSSIGIYRGMLIISQTEEVHREIHLGLAALRKARLSDQPVIFADATSKVAFRKVMEKVMAKKVSVTYKDVPFELVAKLLQDKIGFPITISHRALQDTGLDAQTPVTFESTNMSTRSVLGLLLSQLQLVAIPRYETIHITSIDEAERSLSVRVYPVTDLIAVAESDDKQADANRTASNLQQLTKLIEETVAPNNWDGVGGASTISGFAKCNAFIVATKDGVHLQIERLLRQVRAASKGKNAEPPEDADAARRRWIVTNFEIKEGTEQQVAKMITQFVTPDDWPQKQALEPTGPGVATLPGRVIIRHRQSVVDKVRAFLYDSGIVDPSNQTMGGKGSGVQQHMGHGMMSGGMF